MEVLPELRMAAADAPARHHLVEGSRVADLLQLRNELRHLASPEAEHEVRVAGQHARVDRQGVQPRLIAQRLAGHEGHVAVRAVAQQAVDLALAVGTLDTQQRRLGQLVDHLEPTGRAPGQAAQRLLGILQIGRQAGSVALGAGAAVDRVGASIERVVTLQQRAGERALGPQLRQPHGARRVDIGLGVVQPHLQLAAVLVPVIQVGLARLRRQQAEEVQLGAVADQVEVQARLRLVGDIAEHVEIDHQLVVGALEQRVVQQPQGLRDLADQALAHHGAVVVAVDRQQRIVVAGPQVRPAGRRRFGIGVAAQLLILVALVPVGLPQPQQVADLVELPGHGQQRRGLGTIAGIGDVEVVARVLEHRPEVVADHVGGDLPAAHRPADKGAHEVLGVIQHELVARLGRNRLEGLEGVGAALRAVTGYRIHCPVAGVEQLAHPLQLLRAERIGDMGLVHDDALDRPQPVVHLGARVVIGPARGNRVDRLAAGRA